MNGEKREDLLTLEILEAIDGQSNVTQRHLADHLGVALGLANSYLKRCVRKGLIKIQQVPANRYLYYLTPKGFSEKSRLTARFLSSSFDFYRKASHAYAQLMNLCLQEGRLKIVLCGLSELAEIAILRANEAGIEIVGIYDPTTVNEEKLGYPIFKSIKELNGFDGLMLTAIDNSEHIYGQIKAFENVTELMVPEFLEFVLQELGLNYNK